MTSAPAEYATKRWNPTTGCSPVSAGCANCWASRFALRHAGRFGYPKEHPFTPTFHADRLGEPLRWRKPQTVAVCFMGDIFHPDIPRHAIVDILGIIAAQPQHRFLLLTKRPELAEPIFRDLSAMSRRSSGPIYHSAMPFPPGNLWLGVSAEDQPTLDRRVGDLLRFETSHRWLSLEPQIAAADVTTWVKRLPVSIGSIGWVPGLDWIVQGCESGPRRRPFDIAWARSVRDQCAAAGVPYYLKQVHRCIDYDRCKERRDADECGPSEDCLGKRVVVVKHPTLDGQQHLTTPWRMP